MSCSTLQDQVYNKVIIFSNSTPYTQLFAEVISSHCVKAEKDKIVFLCSCAVSDQVLCIKSDACSQKAEQKKMCSEFRFDSRRALDGLWVSSVSRLNSLQKRNKVEVALWLLHGSGIKNRISEKNFPPNLPTRLGLV